jgi:trehalose 6-phosphate phosphatase
VTSPDRPSAPGLDDEITARLGPLVESPSTTAVLTDFDGTLAPIVEDPTTVRPLPGTVAILGRLAATFGVVAVVSGRPVSFLATQLAGATGVELVGLYGLERAVDGRVVSAAGAESWRPVVASVEERLTGAVPPGVSIEPKGLTVTVHWRTAPDRAGEVESLVEAEVARTGLAPHRGRMSIELRPPLAVDKGSAVSSLIDGRRAACFLGDDLGDLPAFVALDRWAASHHTAAVTVAAVDGESAKEVAAAAQVVVDGPRGALGVLQWLAGAAESGG